MRRPKRKTSLLLACWVKALPLAELLAGCGSPARLMPTPVSLRCGDIGPFEKTGAQAQGTDVPVLQVTHRGAILDKPEPVLQLDRLRPMAVAGAERPGRRGLDAQSSPQGARHWTFPPDFDPRVRRLFAAGAPAPTAPATAPR